MARTTEGVLAGLLALAALLADAGERHISLNGYDDDAQLLFVNLVAPAAGQPHPLSQCGRYALRAGPF